jgi:protein-disulfide isomerase
VKILSPITNGIVSACALTGLGLVLGRAVGAGGARAPAEEPELERVENWDALATGGTEVGPAGAPAVLVTFSDFQCPFCAQLAGMLAGLRRQRPGLVRMVYRHFPLESIHPHAQDAALASECAAEQSRFEAFHDLLYERQKEIGTLAWSGLAQTAAVGDTTAFWRCMEEDRYARRISADVALGESANVSATPTVFLNGMRVRAGLSPGRIRELIVEAARNGGSR